MDIKTANFIGSAGINGLIDTTAGAIGIQTFRRVLGETARSYHGLLFGAVRSFAQYPILYIGDTYLNANHADASTELKTFVKALAIFGSYAIAWGALSFAGLTLSLGHLVSLAVYTELLSSIFRSLFGTIRRTTLSA